VRKFRILFVVFALALVVLVGLLVRRAIESVELERRMRHEAVAERVFDEMERALSAVLTREEERPFGHYGFSYAPPGQLAGAVTLTRSPLAEPPELPFVVGYFQIDPDGSLHTPLRPREGEEAAGWQPSERSSAAVAALEQTVGPYWRAGRGGGRHRVASPSLPLPGNTVMLGGQAAAPPEAEARLQRRDEAAGKQKDKEEVSAYDALRALNKGVEQRAARQAKLSREYAASRPAAVEEKRAAESLRDSPDDAFEEQDIARANELERFELPPMVGQLIDGRSLILYRTVVHEAQVYRQGLLLDVETLGTWLREQGLGVDGEYASVVFSTPFGASPAADPEASFTYLHRFAEPFDDLSARLTLAVLPGMGGATYVYALSALLLVAGVLGLAALYRMVSVVVSFAERRSNFVAAVSHELKTPLTAIRMYGEMLRDGMVPSEAKRDEYHRHITAESERLSRLINNVLEFSRLEKHTRSVNLVNGALGPVVEEAAQLLRPHAEREAFTIGVEVAPNLPPVRFERDAVLQVVFNLVDNAVKYAGNGARHITITCRPDAGGVRLAVRDHGPGVPARHLGKIFEPFYRGESELTRRSKGTGLGLALVRGLVECMGARVVGRNAADGGFEVAVLFRAATA
jgi:signal transduction histidine kinase